MTRENAEIAYAYIAYMQERINRAKTGPERVQLSGLLDEALEVVVDGFDDELVILLEDSNG